MNASTRRYGILLAACLVVIIAASLLAFGIERDFGRIDVQLVRIAEPSGAVLAGKLYRPKAAAPDRRMPAVLALHGYQNDKETQGAFALELARRGFVVLALDQLGHGSSGGRLSFASYFTDPSYTIGAETGYHYLKTLPFVDPERLGVMGHSMGAMTAVKVAALNPDHRVVNPQCGPPGAPSLHNLLLTQALFEEFRGFRENAPRVEPLSNHPNRAKAFGLPGPVEWNTTYGSFADGTARRAALIPTVHPGVTHNAQAVTEAVIWMRQVLQHEDAPRALPDDRHIYMWKEWLMLLAMLATAVSILPLAGILLEQPTFRPVARPMPQRYAAAGGRWWFFATINALIAGVTYPPLTALGGLTDKVQKVLPWFSLQMGNGVMVWFLGNALIFVVLFLIWYRTAGRRAGVTLDDLGASLGNGARMFEWNVAGRTLLLGAILFAWMYLLEGLSEWALGVEFRFLWPFMRQFSAGRLGLFLLYLLPALAFFLLNGGLFLFGQARQRERASSVSTQLVWWLKNCYAALGGLAVVWAIQYVPYLWMGRGPGFEVLGLPQYSQMWPLMLFVFIPEFAVLLFLLTWFFRRTGRIYLGGLMIASMAIWFQAAGSVITR